MRLLKSSSQSTSSLNILVSAHGNLQLNTASLFSITKRFLHASNDGKNARSNRSLSTCQHSGKFLNLCWTDAVGFEKSVTEINSFPFPAAPRSLRCWKQSRSSTATYPTPRCWIAGACPTPCYAAAVFIRFGFRRGGGRSCRVKSRVLAASQGVSWFPHQRSWGVQCRNCHSTHQDFRAG